MDLLTVCTSTVFLITGVTLMVYGGRIGNYLYRNFTSDYNPNKNTDFLRFRSMILGAIFFAGGLVNLIEQFKNWK